jgi:uncharacterized membrane protein
MVNRAFDKIRQSSRGMPAVIIRMLDALTSIATDAVSPLQIAILLRQGEMIVRAAEESVQEANDLQDIQARYQHLRAVSGVDDEKALPGFELPEGRKS